MNFRTVILGIVVAVAPGWATAQATDSDMATDANGLFSQPRVLPQQRAFRALTPRFDHVYQPDWDSGAAPGSWRFFSGGGLARQADDAFDAGIAFDSQPFTAGLDYRLGDDFVLGAALGYRDSDAQGALAGDGDNNGAGLDNDSVSLSLYGAYRGGRFVIDGMVGLGERDLLFSDNAFNPLSAEAAWVDPAYDDDASADSERVFAGLGLAYSIDRGPLNITPSLRFDYLDDPLSNAFAAPKDYRSLTSTLGGQVSYTLDRSWGVLVPFGSFEWVHEFNDDLGTDLIDPHSPLTPADDYGAVSFGQSSLDRDYFNIGFGTAVQFDERRAAFLSYEHILGKDDEPSSAIVGGLRFEF